MHDTELLALIKAQPNKGIDILMEKHMGLVGAIIKGKIGMICTREDIEETASDVFVDFYRNIDSVDLKKGTLRSYLCSIAKNKALNVFRKKSREVKTDDYDDGIDFTIDCPSTDDELINAEIRKRLFDEISKLDKTEREIIFRKYYIGEPTKEIAEKMKMTVSAVDTRAHRAIQKLREKMEDFT